MVRFSRFRRRGIGIVNQQNPSWPTTIRGVERSGKKTLVQLGVLDFGLLIDGKVGIGVVPES